MTDVPFDPADPPVDPPPVVVRPALWRVARRLFTDHDHQGSLVGRPGRCRTCGDPWPCFARRLAERGLLAACKEPPPETADPEPPESQP